MVLLACAATPTFRDQAVVWRVGDARSIPEPTEREFLVMEYLARVLFLRRVDRVFELHTSGPAGNTNALDEVPDSTWFQNRIGRRSMTPEEAALGPGANGVLVNRFFWALGYNVPADHLTVFRPDELTAPAAMTKVVEAILATAPRSGGGTYRAFASELLDGIPKGGWPAEGVRADDPNDVVPHEDRRELRALRVFAAWLGHTDMKEDNTLDMFVDDGGRRFLRHYLIDFGEALGGHAAEKGRREDGWEYVWDWAALTRAFFSFGLWRRPWEDIRPTRWASIGSFTSRGFDPRRWREAYPYFPFADMDAADAYWGCLPLPPPERYTIWRLRVRRPDGARPIMQIHLRGGRVIGLVRVE